MKYFSAIDYQRQLIVASLDDFSPNATLPNYRGWKTDENREIWRQAVIEFLCINIEFKLIEVTHQSEINISHDAQGIKNILLKGDPKRKMDPLILWNTMYFNGTKNLIDIMERFNLRNWNCVNSEKESEDFIVFLKKFYGI